MRLTLESLQNALQANGTVLGVWNPPHCEKCIRSFWDVYQMLYSFGEHDDFSILATDMGTDSAMDKMYGIEGKESSVFRLFVRGSTIPLSYVDTDFDIITWVSMKTGLSPKEDYVFNLNIDNQPEYIKKTKKRNAMVMFYMKESAKSQVSHVEFTAAAEVYRNENILFARVNCKESKEICDYMHIEHYPTFRFLPYEGFPFDHMVYHYEVGEYIYDYLNRELKTSYEMDGSYTTLYGRVDVLDEYAHQFMEKKEKTDRLAIMKKVAKLKSVYRSTYLYYKVMKDILHNSDAILEEQIQSVASLVVSDKQYKKQKKLDNVLHQFEVIRLDVPIVKLTSYNYDYIVNGKQNALILVSFEDCPPCQQLHEVIVGMVWKTESKNAIAKEGVHNVLFGEISASSESFFLRRFKIQSYPTILWIGEGLPNRLPLQSSTLRTKDEIVHFINVQTGQDDKEL